MSPSRTAGPAADVRQAVRDALRDQRTATVRLLAPLGHDEVHRQYHDFLSPIVWDVGHVANFEELWLVRRLADRDAHDPKLDELYNAFENPRWTRGDLPLLPMHEAVTYLDEVRREALAVLDELDVHPEADGPGAGGHVHRMIAQHESQHQETILQSLDLREQVSAWDLGRRHDFRPDVDDWARVHVPGGPFVLGTDDLHWTYDNERPAHLTEVEAFDLDRYPVSNRRFDAFIEAGGYAQPEWWSERGWQWRQEAGVEHPQGWQRDDAGGWRVRRFGHVIELDPAEPVQHVSFHEAEAFATWAGGRLPTEQEWEKAASWDPARNTKRRHPWGELPPDPSLANVGLQRFGPLPIGSLPAGASAIGAEQMAGDVYEWTSSPFEGWPGFRAQPYPEYSEVFFGGDYRVLRGSSWAIAAPMARCTYRNWDHPQRRQIFAGLRVAWTPGAPSRETA